MKVEWWYEYSTTTKSAAKIKKKIANKIRKLNFYFCTKDCVINYYYFAGAGILIGE
jgi:hypothetical protein